MKFARLLLCSTLSLGLTACFALGGTSSSTPEEVVVKPTASPKQNAKTFALYVGGTQKVTPKKGKKAPAAVEVKSGDVTYYTTGPIVQYTDVKNAFVAKTVSGDPALGIRLSPEANKRLTAALSANKGGTVLASLNNSVFSKVNNAGAKLEDGVLLLPMHSLNEARNVAQLLRQR